MLACKESIIIALVVEGHGEPFLPHVGHLKFERPMTYPKNRHKTNECQNLLKPQLLHLNSQETSLRFWISSGGGGTFGRFLARSCLPCKNFSGIRFDMAAPGKEQVALSKVKPICQKLFFKQKTGTCHMSISIHGYIYIYIYIGYTYICMYVHGMYINIYI